MKYLLILLAVVGCNNAEFAINQPSPEPITCEIVPTGILCTDGTFTDLTGPAGQDGLNGLNGQDGIDGQDGETPVILTKTKVLAGQCTKVAEGIYVENIRNGEIFDVYYNDQCRDNLGEFCDNVEPSEGSVGALGTNEAGGAEICWANHKIISGQRIDNDLLIMVLDFN